MENSITEKKKSDFNLSVLKGELPEPKLPVHADSMKLRMKVNISSKPINYNHVNKVKGKFGAFSPTALQCKLTQSEKVKLSGQLTISLCMLILTRVFALRQVSHSRANIPTSSNIQLHHDCLHLSTERQVTSKRGSEVENRLQNNS